MNSAVELKTAVAAVEAWEAFILVAVIGFALAALLLPRIGMYTIAQRRRLRRPWLAWLPIGDNYVLGSISDQYQRAVKGRQTNRRKVLPQLGCVTLLALAGMLVFLVLLFGLSLLSLATIGLIFLNEDFANDARWLLNIVPAVMLVLWILWTWGTILRYLALYDLYRSCKSDECVKYLVLSIVVPMAQPFLIFSCRNHDGGMPSGQEVRAEPWDCIEP